MLEPCAAATSLDQPEVFRLARNSSRITDCLCPMGRLGCNGRDCCRDFLLHGWLNRAVARAMAVYVNFILWFRFCIPPVLSDRLLWVWSYRRPVMRAINRITICIKLCLNAFAPHSQRNRRYLSQPHISGCEWHDTRRCDAGKRVERKSLGLSSASTSRSISPTGNWQG